MNEQDRIQKKIFEEEQAHLTQTHGRLRVMESELEEKIKSISEKAAQEKKDIRSNLSLNFDSDTDSMETYIEFEAMSHSIDQYNIEQDAAKEKLGRVKRLLKAPYFARVTLQFDPEEEPEDYYIGSAGVSENAFEHLVIDWRSPIAETYYNQDNGRTFYMVEGRRVDVDLQLRRQYNLEEDRLHSFFDTQVAIEDPLLLQSLASRRTDKMKAITATIQKEQNAVIRCSDVPVLLVNGIAGSGKTSVLLQRIAYLFYRKRENLRPEQVYLLTINPVFRQYIDQVLPDLGEENPRTITWRDFVHIAKAPDKGPFEPAKESDLRKIEKSLKSLRLEEEDFRPIMQKGRCVLSRREIAKVADSLSEIEPGVRLLHILADRLSEIARVKIRRMERDENEKRSTGEQAGAAGSASFNSMDPYAETDEPGMREQNRIRNEFGGAFSAIEHFSFLDIERIGSRLTKRKKLSSAEWIWLKILLTGMGDKNVKYVMIDEVQDYTAAQLMVLRRYFDRAKFMMLGDEFQAIRPGTVSFEKIRELFGEEGREAVELPLLTSYRSSPEITEIFTGLLPREKRINTASVQRPGTAPVKMGCADSDDYLRRLKALINAAEEEEGLTAIICGNRGSLEKIRELLGDKAPQVISRNQALPGKGTFLITLDLVKGLEFDGVILPDADAKMYPDDLLARHRLYTAVSRATRRLSILADGELTGLLKN
ncbi:MAG: AAA family ATPase [Lachnospiraceae bacterium]|nr:AAA family ATPase [Lachnospiraceae bacterium]